MVLPGTAAQPINAQSTALGLSIRKVVVEQVVPERGIAIVRDEMQYMTEIPYRVQQGRGRIPRVGDFWYVDRSMGPWVFSAYIAKDDEDLATFDGPMTVKGDLDVEGVLGTTDGVNIGKGLFVTEGASITKGLFVGEGTHVVGQLHSVTGITTPGYIRRNGRDLLADGVWTALTLAGGMSVHGGVDDPAFTPAYQLRTANTVRLRGGIAGTISSGTTLLTLPVSIRPTREIRMPCAIAAAGAANQAVRLEIFTSGVVSPSFGGGGSAGFIYLDGVEYDLV